MTDFFIVDSAEREQALDISKSYCVQAPAGSGKTELLIQRFLNLLIHCEKPEDILAFTFTRKAAFEMRQRLLSNLRQENTDEQTELTRQLVEQVLKINQQREWHLLENPQRLQIKTIDAFNASICAQLPVMSGLGGQVEIVEDMEPLFQEAIETSLAKLNDASQFSDYIATFLTQLDNNLAQAKNLLISLLVKRDQWLHHVLRIKHEDLRQELTHNLQAVIAETLTKANVILQPFANDITTLTSYANEHLSRNDNDSLAQLSDEKLPVAEIDQIDAWQTLSGFLLKQDQQFRKTVTINNGFPKPADGKSAEEKALYKCRKDEFIDLINNLQQQAECLSCLQDIQNLPAKDYKEIEWEFLEALTQVLLDIVSELTLILNQNNQADYIHISASALQALSHENSLSDLALRLDYKIKHILVDEFQDTSHLQIELLSRLTEGWQNDDGRSLFIVGDGMQSCYSFRNADVGLFLKTRDEGIGAIELNSLQLKMNFRSNKAVVSWVNQIFSQAFPQQDNIGYGAVSYSPGEAVKAEEAPGVTTTLLVENSEQKAPMSLARQQEAQGLVKQLKAIITKPNVSVAILVKNRSHLKEIIPLLRQSEIAWNASDIDPLSAFPVVNDLLSLLQALTNLADKTALLALLRTPFIGLTIKDIHALTLFAEQHETTLWQCLSNFQELDSISADAKQRLRRVMPALSQARNSRQNRPAREWLENSWLNLGGPACLQNEHELRCVERFFLLLETTSVVGPVKNIQAFARKCGTTYLSANHDSSTSLHIMTIHKAKGLEFDYVFIPGLDREPRRNDKQLFLWQEQTSADTDSRLIIAPLNAKGEKDNPTYLYLKQQADIRRKLENTRLFYIAVTRARQQAFLYGKIKTNKKNEYQSPAENSLLAAVWPVLEKSESEFNTINLEPANNVINESKTKIIKTRRLKAEWTPASETSLPDTFHSSWDADETHQHLIEKTIGDIIHECLRLKVEKAVDILEPDFLNRQEYYWRTLLKTVCPDTEDIDEALIRIKHNLSNCLQHEKSQWLFDHSHQASACELAISDYRQRWRKEHIIDRTFVADGIRWIIDYKSSVLSQNQSQEEFLNIQEEHYKDQLQRYADLFRIMEDLPVRTVLFFTSLPYWHEIKL
jgi:ATP-dependent exoDNAse (exonuclease V) beta subunit